VELSIVGRWHGATLPSKRLAGINGSVVSGDCFDPLVNSREAGEEKDGNMNELEALYSGTLIFRHSTIRLES
jgi:hypothetical protein